MDIELNKKKILQLLFPILFAVISASMYIFFYKPESGGVETTTIFMVFFAALGWSGIIYLGEEGLIKFSYVYSVISFLAPLFLFEFIRVLPYDDEWHRVILLIIFAANLWLIDIYKNRKNGKEG